MQTSHLSTTFHHCSTFTENNHVHYSPLAQELFFLMHPCALNSNNKVFLNEKFIDCKKKLKSGYELIQITKIAIHTLNLPKNEFIIKFIDNKKMTLPTYYFDALILDSEIFAEIFKDEKLGNSINLNLKKNDFFYLIKYAYRDLDDINDSDKVSFNSNPIGLTLEKIYFFYDVYKFKSFNILIDNFFNVYFKTPWFNETLKLHAASRLLPLTSRDPLINNHLKLFFQNMMNLMSQKNNAILPDISLENNEFNIDNFLEYSNLIFEEKSGALLSSQLE